MFDFYVSLVLRPVLREDSLESKSGHENNIFDPIYDIGYLNLKILSRPTTPRPHLAFAADCTATPCDKYRCQSSEGFLWAEM